MTADRPLTPDIDQLYVSYKLTICCGDWFPHLQSQRLIIRCHRLL